MKNYYLILVIICTMTYTGMSAQLSICPQTGFGGNSNVTISSITPIIHVQDTQGEAPFYLYASAFQSTGVGTTNPFSDIEYSWDFGDTSITGGMQLTHPVDNSTVTVNSSQTGPEAAFLYETPGSYTVTLTARAWDGTKYVTAQTTQIITVTAWSGQDAYFDPTGGSDINDGSINTPWQTWNQLVTWLNGGNKRRALIKSGETMSVTKTLSTKKSDLRISSYGTGALPILLASAGMQDQNMIFVNARNIDIYRHKFSNLEFDANSIAAAIYSGFAAAPSTLENMVFSNCKFKNGGDTSMILTTGDGTRKSILIWNCTFNANQGKAQSFVPVATPYCAVIGGFFDGGNGHVVRDHHMYINNCDHSLVRWVKFGTAVARNFCLNMNAPHVNKDFLYTLIDGCDITGTNNGIDFSNKNNDTKTGRFSQTIVQNCAIHDLTNGTQGMGVFGYSIKDLTVRYNHFFNNPSADIKINDDTVVYSIYNNKFFVPVNMTHTAFVTLTGQKGYFGYNIMHNETTSNGSILGDFSIKTDWVIDNNQYHNPSLTKPFYDKGSGTPYTLSEWQALGFDVNGVESDPMFPSPSTGDFGSLQSADFTSLVTGFDVSFTNQTLSNFVNWNSTFTYSWDFGDSSVIDTTMNPSHTYVINGDYTVGLTVTNACGSTTVSKVITINNSLGLNDFENGNSLSVYPLPMRDELIIQLNNIIENVDLKLFNLQGELIKAQKEKNVEQIKVSTANLPAQIYILRIQSNHDLKVLKVVKK